MIKQASKPLSPYFPWSHGVPGGLVVSSFGVFLTIFLLKDMVLLGSTGA
jgi:hypothetical protein